MSDSTPENHERETTSSDFVVIAVPQDVARAKIGKAHILTLLKSMGCVELDREHSESPVTDDVREVFDHHQRVLSEHFKRGIKLVDWRSKIIRSRLKRYSVEDLKAVIDYTASSPFHCGANDSGKKYLDFDHIMGNDKKVERKLSAISENEGSDVEQVRLTLTKLGVKMRSGRADYSDKDTFIRTNALLKSLTGEQYRWKEDAFTRGD